MTLAVDEIEKKIDKAYGLVTTQGSQQSDIDESFKEAVESVCQHLGGGDDAEREMADAIDVNSSSVKRWRKNTRLPPNVAKKAMLEELKAFNRKRSGLGLD